MEMNVSDLKQRHCIGSAHVPFALTDNRPWSQHSEAFKPRMLKAQVWENGKNSAYSIKLQSFNNL